MAWVDPFDVAIIVFLLAFFLAYNSRGKLWAASKGAKIESVETVDDDDDDNDGNIVTVMKNNGKDCVIFFSSQTGTAEAHAKKLAKEGSSTNGPKCMVADLEMFDDEHIAPFPDDEITIFVLATCGEGDPTDNATGFWELVASGNPSFKSTGALKTCA